LDVKFDFIISNPPYIADGDGHLAHDGLPWEPQKALRSGDDGLDDIIIITKEAPEHLSHNGCLFLEHGFDQADQVRLILKESGFSAINTYQDLSGHDRVTMGQIS
jgi:release factor glutamine methyltransferase